MKLHILLPIAFLLFIGIAQATDINACGAVSSAGTYNVIADLTTTGAGVSCLSITASNVIINGQNHLITGDNSASTTGIKVSAGASNVNITDLNISGYFHSINLTGANSVFINNLTINASMVNGWGVYVVNSNYSTINASTINSTANTAYGIVSGAALTYNITISNNKFFSNSTNDFPIYFNSQNWTIYNNTINTSGSADGIRIEGTGARFNQISFNVINSTSGGAALHLNDGANNSIFNNTLSTSASGVRVLVIDAGQNNTYANNTIRSSGSSSYAVFVTGPAVRFNTFSFNFINTTASVAYGLVLGTGANNTVNSNTIYTSGDSAPGFEISTGQNNTVSNNTINTSGSLSAGIIIDQAAGRFNVLANNTINTSGSGYGIDLDPAHNITVANNTVWTNSGYGIRLAAASNNSITSNIVTVSMAAAYGIYGRSSSNSNSITYNIVNATTGYGILFEGTNSNNYIGFNNVTMTTGKAVGLVTSSNTNTVESNILNTSTGYGIYAIASSHFNNLTNNTINATSGYGIYDSGGNNFTISNNSVYAAGTAVTLLSSANNALLFNNTLVTTGGVGIQVDGGHAGNAYNNTIRTAGSSAHGIFFDGASQNWTITNNTINTSGANSHGLYLAAAQVFQNNFTSNIVNTTSATGEAVNISAGANNTFTNNTLSSESAITADFAAASANTSFHWNNIKKGSKFIRNLNATNQFNISVGLYQQGNFYTDTPLLLIFDANNDGFGDVGQQYPYNATFTLNWSGLGADYGPAIANKPPAPLINQIYVLPVSPTLADNLTCWVNATSTLNTSLNIFYSWILNGVNQTALAGNWTIANNSLANVSNVSSSQLTPVQNWSCTAVAMDGYANSTQANSTNVSTPGLSIVATLTYPASGTIFGPNQCWVIATINTTDNGPPSLARSSSISLYGWDGIAGHAYALIQTLTNSTSANASMNFSITPSQTQHFSVNGTGVVDGSSNTTGNITFQIIGQSFCPGGADYQDSALWIWVAIIAAVLSFGAMRVFAWQGVGLTLLFVLVGATVYLADTVGDAGLTELVVVVQAYFIFTILLLLGAILVYGYNFMRDMLGGLGGRA